MKQFCRYAATVLFLLFQTLLFRVNGQVLTARFKSITPNTNAYYEYLPVGYNPNDTARYPLLIHMIGAGDLGTGTPSTITLLLRSGPVFEISSGVFPDSFVVNGKTFGFIVIDPQFMVQPTVTTSIPSSISPSPITTSTLPESTSPVSVWVEALPGNT